MFHLETEFFSWDFMAWTINFLIVVLLVIVASFLLRRRFDLSPTEGDECGQEDMQSYAPTFEKYLKALRTSAVDIWSGRPWLLALSPLFFLLLFLSAVHFG